MAARPQSADQETSTFKLSEVRIRDPFILAVEAAKTYYLVTSTTRPSGSGRGVSVLTSKDLQTWQGPSSVFDVPADFWGQAGVWAPEMHAYKGKYYIFTTFYSDERIFEQWPDWPARIRRGSQVLVADSPLGPFKPFHNRAHTPRDLMTLDGTLWVEDDVPYMVYCHEWVQIKDGAVAAIRLKDDLSDVVGDPVTLFRASEASWTPDDRDRYVTDGPFLYRTSTGKLLTIWSSFTATGYTTGIAVSRSGKLHGPWLHQPKPLFSKDGGHGMIFRKFDGTLMLVLHCPNRGPDERACLFELEDTGDSIRIKNEGEDLSHEGKTAAKALFRDPVHDGAADPVLCWNRAESKWFMFYTNRRANVPNTPGVSWVHGTRIGIAESSDGGATWTYRGTADIDYGQGEYSHWAPEVIEHNGTYHMYLSFVPGIFTHWNAPRDIIHLTSKDLLKWRYESTLKLASGKVIDATVIQLPDGTWRMWYKNEGDHSWIYHADSPDLFTWKDRGKAIGDQSGEGAKAFRWKGRYWMLVDVWDGLGVYSSDDCSSWTRQKRNLLREPGQKPTDRGRGGHPDVVVSGDRAFLFYFIHQGGRDAKPNDPYAERRSLIQVVELEYKGGELTCDRDKPTHIQLQPKP
jgi:GH43 family beta-xylosidase